MIVTSGSRAVGGTLYRTAVGPFTPTIDFNLGGYTLVAKYAPAVLASSGAGIRLVLRGPVVSGHTCSLSNVTISLVANTAGSDLYDSSASPTAVTFGGSASLSLIRGGTYYSDNISFSVDRTRAVLIAFNLASGTQWAPFVGSLSTQSYFHYWRAATTEAATTNRTTGYSAASGASPFLGELQVYS